MSRYCSQCHKEAADGVEVPTPTVGAYAIVCKDCIVNMILNRREE